MAFRCLEGWWSTWLKKYMNSEKRCDHQDKATTICTGDFWGLCELYMYRYMYNITCNTKPVALYKALQEWGKVVIHGMNQMIWFNTTEVWGESRFIFKVGYLWLWSVVPSSQKKEFESQNCQDCNFFPTVFNGCCSLLQQLKFKYHSLSNAWRTGLETSSGYEQG